MPAPSLHGRDAPVRALGDALAAAHAGRGQLVVIAGEPGIGKSAIAEVIAAEAEGLGALVTWGRAWEFAEAPAYFPVRPCVRSLEIDLAADGELEDRRAFDLWERVLASLARQARARTVVWLIEDIHAADLGTLDLLTYLVQPVRALRVLIVATLRPHDPRLDDRKLQRIARMSRDGTEIRLGPLDEPAISAIAEDMLGRPLPDAALHRLAQLTGGNPLFAVECARAVRGGGLDRVLDQLPPTVRHLVNERVALLPVVTREALEAGAVLGREFAAATVAGMAGQPPSRVIDDIVPALRAGIVRETQPARFVFSHVLVRDAIEQELPAARRWQLHAAAGRTLRDLGDNTEVLIERARHALAAAHGGIDTGDALSLSQRAAEQLEREGAVDRAFDLRTRIEEARASGVLPPTTAVEKLHLARIARDAGRVDVTQRACDEIFETARASADPELFAHAALLHATIVRPGVVDARQVALLEEADAALVPGTATACRVRARLATALQPADDTSVPISLARAALRDARSLDDETVVIDVLELGALGLWGSPRAECIAWCEELRDRALGADDIRAALTAWSLLATWHVEGGEIDRFVQACDQALALAERATHPRHRWEALLLASGRACALGSFAESERYITEVGQIAALIDDPALEVALVCHELGRARLRRRADELAAPLSRLDHAVRDFKRGEIVAAVMRAGCHARLGDVAATRAELAAVGTQARAVAVDSEVVACLGEAYCVAGTDDDRRWARDALVNGPVTDVFSLGTGYLYETPVDRVVGLLDAALGDLAGAESRLRRAHHRATERGMRPWVALLAHELAIVVARRGGDGRALAAQAAALGSELGMHGFGEVAIDDPGDQLRMSRIADVWTIQRGARTARIKDSRGAQLLARLVDRPGEDIHVLALASDGGGSVPESHAGELLDERARKAYRARIGELDEALAVAEQRGDLQAALRFGREREAIARELSRATGLGGRARVAGSETERARVNVQRRLKEALARVTDTDPVLGAYLQAAVRTGTFCCFRP